MNTNHVENNTKTQTPKIECNDLLKMQNECKHDKPYFTYDCDGFICVECGKNVFYAELNNENSDDKEDAVCTECDGEGTCDYGYGEDVRTYPCEKCSDGGNDDDDRAYDAMKDAEAERECELEMTTQ